MPFLSPIHHSNCMPLMTRHFVKYAQLEQRIMCLCFVQLWYRYSHPEGSSNCETPGHTSKTSPQSMQDRNLDRRALSKKPELHFADSWICCCHYHGYSVAASVAARACVSSSNFSSCQQFLQHHAVGKGTTDQEQSTSVGIASKQHKYRRHTIAGYVPLLMDLDRLQ